MHVRPAAWRGLVLVLVVVAFGNGTPGAVPGTAATARAGPSVAIDVATAGPGAAAPVSRVVPGQSVRVTCRYRNLVDGPYEVRVVWSGVGGDATNVTPGDGGVETNRARVTDANGSVVFEFTPSPAGYEPGREFAVACVASPERGPTDELRSSRTLEWAATTVYHDIVADAVLETEPLPVSYYGWTVEPPLTVALVVEGQTVAEHRVDATTDANAFRGRFDPVVPGAFVDVTTDRTLSVRLAWRRPGGPNTYSERTIEVATAPRVVLDVDENATYLTGSQVPFAARAYDLDGGGVENYTWRFGDGFRATERSPTHTYRSPGEYTVTLAVTDDEGVTNTTRATVTVRNPTLWERLQSLPPEAFSNVLGEFLALLAAVVGLLVVVLEVLPRLRRARNGGE